MSKVLIKKCTTLALSLLLSLSGIERVAADDSVVIEAIGTWDYFTNYQKHEGPFWNERIADVSGGKIASEIKPFTELGLQGHEIMALIKKGVFDFAFGMSGYVVPDLEIFGGADLSALTQNITVQREVANAYFPTLELAFAEKYNAKLMLLYPFPSQMIWCNAEIHDISDLKGKRVRVYKTTHEDFIESVGAIPVSASFNDVPQALENGTLDCAITGTMSAYAVELYKVAPFGFTMRVGWGLSFGVMNMNKWNLLSDGQQQLLQRELSQLSEQMWQETAKEDAVALACLTDGPCRIGETGKMVLTHPSNSDIEVRNKVANEVVLPRWAQRCGPECAANWNRTVGKVLNLRAKMPPNDH